MVTYDLLKGFCKGKIKGGRASNLRVEGNKLYNYNTLLAVNIKGTVYLNSNKYSQTTSKHQNRIRRLANKLIEITEQEIYTMS